MGLLCRPQEKYLGCAIVQYSVLQARYSFHAVFNAERYTFNELIEKLTSHTGTETILPEAISI
jgi:hypothetical protein